MRKSILTILVSFLIFSFTFAQTIQVDVNVLRQIVELVQTAVRNATPSLTVPLPQPTLPESASGLPALSTPPSAVETKTVPLPKGVSPAVPIEKPITPEVIRSILPDESRENDVIIQLNNLRITRIATSVPEVKAIFFAVRDVGWGCSRFENEKVGQGIPCPLDLRKPITWKELVIKITDDTVLLQINRQRAKLEDFQVNDKINVYGFMDRDNYGIEALIVRKVGATKIAPLPKPLPSPITPLPKPTSSVPRACIQVITPAYNPNNPSECKEFPTPCDVPPGWMKTDRCPVSGGSQPLPSLMTTQEFKVEADDYGFYPATIEVPQGSNVSLVFVVKSTGVYYGGLDFRSEKFKTEPVKPGNSIKVQFIADKDFIISSYWPLSNVKKAEMRVIVRQ